MFKTVFIALMIIVGTNGASSADPMTYPDSSIRFSVDTIPTIHIQEASACDIMLQAGERINQSIISDSIRWKMTDGISADTPHIFLKPVSTGLHAVLIITTTRRTYHVYLVSTPQPRDVFVGFYYPAPIASLSSHAPPPAPSTPSPAWSCAKPLDARYRIYGARDFKPRSVCNDRVRTYINMGSIQGALPILVTVGEGNQDQIVGNPSWDSAHAEYIVDGVPDKLALVRDGKKGQRRVNVVRNAK